MGGGGGGGGGEGAGDPPPPPPHAVSRVDEDSIATALRRETRAEGAGGLPRRLMAGRIALSFMKRTTWAPPAGRDPQLPRLESLRCRKAHAADDAGGLVGERHVAAE